MPSEHTGGWEAERAALRDALFALFNMAAIQRFEPDEGQPHPLKDGVYDKVMAQAYAALALTAGETW